MRDSIETLLLEPFRLFNDPSERVWWPAVCAGLLIACGRRRLVAAESRRGDDSPAYACHPSSWVAEFVIVRAAVRIFVGAPFRGEVSRCQDGPDKL